MVLLLNLLVYVLIILIIVAGHFYVKKTGKLLKGVSTVLLSIVLVVFLHTLIRPSYLPKGKATPMPPVPFEEIEEQPIQDRVRKPDMSQEEREKHFKETFTVRQEVKEILEKKDDTPSSEK